MTPQEIDELERLYELTADENLSLIGLGQKYADIFKLCLANLPTIIADLRALARLREAISKLDRVLDTDAYDQTFWFYTEESVKPVIAAATEPVSC